MAEQIILKMRESLLKRRREIFELIEKLEEGQKNLAERVIESGCPIISDATYGSKHHRGEVF
jgi:hypothetical protein